MSHAALLYYAHTPQKKFPLILVMGREPNLNDAHALELTAGAYDFDAHPRCNFWNQAYGALASLAGMTAAQLKSVCRNNNASPIVFGYGSCRCMESKIRDKNAVRAQIRTEAIEAQLAYTFNHRLMNRVDAVILSGWQTPGLRRNLDLATRILADKKVLCIPDMPFFYSGNRARVDRTLARYKQPLKKTIETFVE